MLETKGAADAVGGSLGEPTAPFRPRAAKKPVLIIVHQVHSTPGHVGQWFQRNGYRLDIRRHFAGDPLPETLADHCGALIFGGPQSANDSFDYIRREIDWIGVPLAERKPFLGICLGAQMLAKHLGGRVDHAPTGHVEIGYHQLQATEAGAGIGGFPEHVFQWHREGFDVPSGGRLLATGSGAYPNQAFSYGPAAFGVQFHPEIMFVQVLRWSGSNPMRLFLRGATPRQQQIEAHFTHAAKVHQWLDRFLTGWVAGKCHVE